MLPRTRWRCLECTLKSLSNPSEASSPSRLPPLTRNRNFSSTPRSNSKIGRTPLSIPPGVTFEILLPETQKRRRDEAPQRQAETYNVQIKGPLGEMTMAVMPFIKISRETPDGPPILNIENPKEKFQKAMWGTTRAYLANHILGVSEGHTAILRLVGVGYRAEIISNPTTTSPEYPGQQFVNLKVGYSHPVELGVPGGVKASCPQPTRILLEGVEKEVVMAFAAKIRKWRVPEPYKGKGIFVNGETIKLKNKKIK